MRRACIVLALLLGGFDPASAQDPKGNKPASPRAPVTPTTTPRPRARIASRVYVGEPAPAFELDASNGRAVRLGAQRGRWVLLVFDESRAALVARRDLASEVGDLAITVLGVCNEKARTLQTRASRDSVPFLLLADVTGEVSALYGLWDDERDSTRPGFVLVDRDGFVRMALLGSSLPVQDIARLVHFAVTGS